MFERPNYSRRNCLALLAAATTGTVLDAAALPKVPGFQLYTVRALLKKDPDATLRTLAEIGFRDAEGYDRAATVALSPKIKQNGLTVRSCQVETPLITNNWEPYPELKPVTLAEAIESVAAIGAEYFTMGYIAPGARGDGDDFYRRTADRMNAAAELCRKAGLKFAWQTHAFEFGGRPGARPVDIYRERLEPKLVSTELDVFWASVAGEDPVRLLKEWKGHVPLVRLSDKDKGYTAPVYGDTGTGRVRRNGRWEYRFRGDSEGRNRCRSEVLFRRAGRFGRSDRESAEKFPETELGGTGLRQPLHTSLTAPGILSARGPVARCRALRKMGPQ